MESGRCLVSTKFVKDGRNGRARLLLRFVSMITRNYIITNGGHTVACLKAN
jgi:hypothetical protein